jgi:phage shock protein PspC (stress-responsive transcriptional regulator)
MHTAQPSLIARDDTLFGVCAGLAEDFGVNPLWLRLVFAVALLWNPAVVVGVYAAAGVLVLASRLAFPEPKLAAPAAAAAAEAAPSAPSVSSAGRSEPEPLAIAA